MATPVTEVTLIWKILSIVGAALGSIITGNYFWNKNQNQKEKDMQQAVNQSHNDRLAKVENKAKEQDSKFTTESRTREIFKEEISFLKEEMFKISSTQKESDIKTSLALDDSKSSVQDLVKELAVNNAVAQTRKEIEQQLKANK